MANDAAVTLGSYRAQLDLINGQLVDLLAERMQVCRRIARLKSAHGISMMQPQRISSTLEQVRSLSGARQLCPDYVGRLFRLIIDETCDEELRIMASAANRRDEGCAC